MQMRQGDKEARRQGEAPLAPSPCPLVPLSPALSPCLFLPLAQTAQPPLSHHAATHPFLMALTFPPAIALIAWLYRAQQRIASRRLVATLTTLRLLLLACLAIMLLQPAFRWVHRRASAGTLWLVLD